MQGQLPCDQTVHWPANMHSLCQCVSKQSPQHPRGAGYLEACEPVCMGKPQRSARSPPCSVAGQHMLPCLCSTISRIATGWLPEPRASSAPAGAPALVAQARRQRVELAREAQAERGLGARCRARARRPGAAALPAGRGAGVAVAALQHGQVAVQRRARVCAGLCCGAGRCGAPRVCPARQALHTLLRQTCLTAHGCTA